MSSLLARYPRYQTFFVPQPFTGKLQITPLQIANPPYLGPHCPAAFAPIAELTSLLPSRCLAAFRRLTITRFPAAPQHIADIAKVPGHLPNCFLKPPGLVSLTHYNFW
ncbi:hypothetical protein TNCV_149311 [Trichonephila clavipes]|nr:hypothetical protein TNCV_149311 [Trichonephila clavipes]